jgi:hypothetical protein
MPEEKLRLDRFGYELLALTGLMLLVALRFFPMLGDNRLYWPAGDNVFIYGPMFAETARLALHGVFPYYLPSFGTGFPVFESPEYCVCYPFYFFGLLDYGGPLQSLYTLTHLAIFHRFLFALNLYSMLRCARISPWAAFASASIGVVAGNTELYSIWITIAASYTWMPLLIGGAILILRFPGQFWGILLLGGSAGLLALAQAAQPVSHALFFCVILFSAGMTWLILRRDSTAVVRLILSLVAAGAIAFGLAAVSAVPVLLGIEGMIRHIGDGSVLGHQAIPWEKFKRWQLTVAQLVAGILIKPASISIVGSPYVGPLGLVGVASALLFFRRLDSMGRFLVSVIGAIGLYGLLSACGTHLGFAYLNYHLPLMNKSREAGRHLVLFLIAVVFLAGFGLDQIGNLMAELGAGRKERLRVWLPVVVMLLIAVAIVAWELWTSAPLSKGGWLVLLLAPIVVLLGLLFRVKATPVLALAAILASVASAISPPRISEIVRESGKSGYVASANLRSLQILSAIRDRIEPRDFRIDFRDRQFSPFSWGMNSSYFGFNSFYNKLSPQPYDQFRFSLERDTPYLRAMMGTRYVLCSADEKPTDPGAEVRLEVQGYKLFENATYMGRLALVHTLAGTIKEENQFIAEAGRGFDFLKSAYIQEKDASRVEEFLSKIPVETSAVDDRLYVIRNSINQVTAVVESIQPGVLVLNEWFIPAWRARVNGDSKPILRVNQWQVGVAVRAGKNVVEFTYRPAVSWELLILNRVTWLVLAALVLARVARLLFFPLTPIRVGLGAKPMPSPSQGPL